MEAGGVCRTGFDSVVNKADVKNGKEGALVLEGHRPPGRAGPTKRRRADAVMRPVALSADASPGVRGGFQEYLWMLCQAVCAFPPRDQCLKVGLSFELRDKDAEGAEITVAS